MSISYIKVYNRATVTLILQDWPVHVVNTLTYPFNPDTLTLLDKCW